MPPHENLGPPLEAEGAPAESGTPTDHSNVNSNFIKQYCNATLGRWSPLTWALSYAAAGHLVIPLEHGRNIPHRLLLGSGWSAKAGTAGAPGCGAGWGSQAAFAAPSGTSVRKPRSISSGSSHLGECCDCDRGHTH